MSGKLYVIAHDPEARSALVGIAAVLLSFGSGLLLENAAHLNADVPLLAVVLALTLGRTQRGADLRGRLIGLFVLPLVAVAASEIGSLMVRHPDFGDTLFTLSVSLSIWLRRFGFRAAKAGTLIAMPFVAVLVTPIPLPPGHRATLWSALVALIAFLWVCAAQLVADRCGFLPDATAGGGPGNSPHAKQPAGQHATRPATAPVRRPLPSTRMAVQMALTLGAAFVVGRWGFSPHWTWTVITAFVVCSGNRGRGDVVFKSLLRLGGAAGGTVVATVLAGAFGPHDNRSIVLIFVVLAVANWLRSYSYAYWAGCVTSVLALLQGYFGEVRDDLLLTRLEEILVGAALAVTVSWFVLPVRTTDVMRRRVGDALITLGALLPAVRDDPPALDELGARFAANLEQIEQVATPARTYRAAARRIGFIQRGSFGRLADAIDAVQRCAEPVRLLVQSAAGAQDARPERGTKSLVAQIRGNVAEAKGVLSAVRPGPNPDAGPKPVLDPGSSEPVLAARPQPLPQPQTGSDGAPGPGSDSASVSAH